MKKANIIIGLLIIANTLGFAQMPLNDTHIGDAIENEYRFDHAVNVNKVDVRVIDGIVELTGSVDNLKAKERAAKIAQLVKGVRSVSNRIKVEPPVVYSDAGIKHNVETALFQDPATDLYELNVSVTDKVVTLSGTVDSYQEKSLSEDVAKSVKGVVGLNNAIDITYKVNRPDLEIKADIEQALKWNVQVDDGLIEVEVNKGEVTLNGVVGSAAEKKIALYSSWVAGVSSVNTDGLTVEWWAEDKDLRKNKSQAVSDQEIEEAIKDAALYDPRVASFKISPEANQGWVTLRGTVDNLKAKMSAEKLAENTTGVLGVSNRIKVQPIDYPSASEIESSIEQALKNNAITDAYEILVEVRGGIATLSGVVDSYLEKTEAEWVVAAVEGVNEVNNQLRVHYPYGYYWYGYYPFYDIFHSPLTHVGNLIPDDELIAKHVEDEIWWSPYVDKDQVTITVNNGEVTLEGHVDSWKEYQKAAENAWEGGAWSVNNMLQVVE